MDSIGGNSLIQGVGGALLIGLSGFLYLHASYFQRFQYASASAQTKASLSFAYGILFLIVAVLLIPLLAKSFPLASSAIKEHWAKVASVMKLHPSFFVAPLLGILFGFLGNVIRLVVHSDSIFLKERNHKLHTTKLLPRMKLAALSAYAAITDDRLVATLWRAVTLGKLVQITLKSRKVYIGPIVASVDPSAIGNGWLKIIPILSGFRDKDSLYFVNTTDYLPLFEDMASGNGAVFGEMQKIPSGFDREDLGVLIPWAEVVSLTIHDPNLNDFFSAQTMDEEADEEEDEGNEESIRFSKGILAGSDIEVTLKSRPSE